MPAHDDEHITWPTASNLITREATRLQNPLTSRERARRDEAVLFREVALWTSMLVQNTKKIVVYLLDVEGKNMSGRECLLRATLVGYLVEVTQIYSVYGLPCSIHDDEFLQFSAQLSQLLRTADPSVPFYTRDRYPLLTNLTNLVYHSVSDHLGRPEPTPALKLPFERNLHRDHSAKWLRSALHQLTNGDTLQRRFPYAFVYGTFLEISGGTWIGANRRQLNIYLSHDVRRLILAHRRTILLEDSLFPDFGHRSRESEWHGI